MKKWKKRQALGLPRGGRPRKPKMIVDEEEEELEEVEMSEGLSDQEEYMEYSIVQHEVMCVLVNASYHSYRTHESFEEEVLLFYENQ